LTRTPVIASHSAARHFTPGFERNMSDELIEAMARNGGVIQVPFGSGFLTAEANDWRVQMQDAMQSWMTETGAARDSDEARSWMGDYMTQHPFPYATIADVANHIEHIIGIAGVAHVGIGSDFDGVGDSLPEGLKDVSGYPALIEELLRREHSVKDIEAILGANLIRVWQQVEKYAADQAKTANSTQ